MEKVKDTKDVKKKPAQPVKKPRANFGEYIRGVRTEIKKVVWPTRKELTSFTVVVVIACTFFAVLFAVVDYAVLAGLEAMLGISLG